MKRMLLFIAAAALTLPAPAALQAAEPDWGQVESSELILFYPGLASIEWVLGEIRIDQERHSGSRVFRLGDRCIECHLENPEELLDIGDAIVSGELLEPEPIPGKAGAIVATVQAAYSSDTLFLKLRWEQPVASGGSKMDPDNPMKIGFMLDAGKIEFADQSGCWASCHADSRGMSDSDGERGKYVKDGSVADGVFYDLAQWQSGMGKAIDGHVAEERVMSGGTALKTVRGEREGDTWTVVFERSFSGSASNITLEPGKVYNIGVAIHDDHASGRFHHVTMGYTLGLGTEADIVAKSF